MPGWLSSLREAILQASPLRRAMLALLVVLPLAALGMAYWWLNPAEYRTLYPKLSDRASGEVIAALEQLDIPYRLSAADGSIEVPAEHLHQARYRLAARGLPRTESDAQTEAERAPGFGASSLQEQQQQLQRALERDLARSIQMLEAVELARVHLALPRVSPFLRDAPAATAAVLVRLRAGAQLSTEQVETIQTLVAASVPRMQRAAVQVIDPRGALLSGVPPAPAQAQRLALEQDLAHRVLAVLEPWLGQGRVNVQVTATLEEGETRQTIERVRPLGPAAAARPLEKTVRVTRIPEGSVQRIQAIVVLGFEASQADIRRASQMASQALGLVAARGDRLSVYALPSTPSSRPATVAKPVDTPHPAQTPTRLPAVELKAAAPAPGPSGGTLGLVAAAVLGLALLLGWLRRRGARPAPEVPAIEDFDAFLDSVRNQVIANPRVAADVIKLWMRA